MSSVTVPRKLMAAQLSDIPEPILSLRGDTPPELAALVMRCLEKEPIDRPQRALELVRILEVVSAGAEQSSRARAADGSLARRLGIGFAALIAVSILARASIIALGLPEWTLPVMLVATILATVASIGRARSAARVVTPLTTVRRGE